MISSKNTTSPGSSSSVGWNGVGGSGFVTSSVEIVLVVLEEPALVRLVLGFLLWLGVGRALQGGVTLRVISG